MTKKIVKKRFWVIDGWNSTEKIFHKKYAVHTISEKQLIQMLQVLTAKYSLDDEEITNYFTNNNSLLNVRKESSREPKVYAFHCGSNPYFIANMVEE